MKKNKNEIYEFTADLTASTYLTPKYITDALGPFDLDPCASSPRPWDIAKYSCVGEHNGGECGLKHEWDGFVWCNPPFGTRKIERNFIQKMANHNNGIALTNVKTATKMWSEIVFKKATGFLFFHKRIIFLNTKGESTGGTFGNQCLIAFGEHAFNKLSELKDFGTIIKNNDSKSS